MKRSSLLSPTTFSLSTSELGSFFTAHRSEFLSHSRRLLGATAEAEEVVQDALVRVLLASPELESVEHARAYFHKVIENLSIDIQRRNGRQPRLVVLDEVSTKDENLWVQDSDLSAVVEQADDAAIIREAISLLSPAERAALVMWEFEGRSTSEIAKELGVKEASVRHTVSRARANLRRVLAERIIDEERGLTALDLLSVTFRKAEGIAKKSSKVALSAILVLTAFLGFNSFSPSDLMSDQSEVSSVQSSPEVENSPELFDGSENQGGGIEQGSPEVTADEVIATQPRIRIQDFNLSTARSSFAGLNGEGIPTGFTVADSRGNLGVLFPGQPKVMPTETGLLLSNIVSTRSGAANVLINQSVVVDSFGTSYLAEVSVGINGGWQPLDLSFISSDVERLTSGNYLLTAIMMVDSVLETAVKVPTSTSGTDLSSAPELISTRVMLDPTKTKILAQAVLVSADSQGDGA